MLFTARPSLKIPHPGFKDPHILLPVNVYGHGSAPSLAVCHLAQTAAVGRGDAFDCGVGTVYIPFGIHGNISVRIRIPCRHLSVCKQPVNPCLRRHKPSLAMACGIDIGPARLRLCQPGRKIRNHFGVYHPRNVTDISTSSPISATRMSTPRRRLRYRLPTRHGSTP